MSQDENNPRALAAKEVLNLDVDAKASIDIAVANDVIPNPPPWFFPQHVSFFPDKSLLYIGLFENDLRNGPGTLILPDGTVYTGFFDNDELLDSHTDQSIKLGDQAFIEAETKAALSNTNLPIEADSLFLSPSAKTSKS